MCSLKFFSFLNCFLCFYHLILGTNTLLQNQMHILLFRELFNISLGTAQCCLLPPYWNNNMATRVVAPTVSVVCIMALTSAGTSGLLRSIVLHLHTGDRHALYWPPSASLCSWPLWILLPLLLPLPTSSSSSSSGASPSDFSVAFVISRLSPSLFRIFFSHRKEKSEKKWRDTVTWFILGMQRYQYLSIHPFSWPA